MIKIQEYEVMERLAAHTYKYKKFRVERGVSIFGFFIPIQCLSNYTHPTMTNYWSILVNWDDYFDSLDEATAAIKRKYWKKGYIKNASYTVTLDP